MERGASLVVYGVDGGVVVEQDLHAGTALRVVGVADTVIERRHTLRVLVVGRRAQRQQSLDIISHTEITPVYLTYTPCFTVLSATFYVTAIILLYTKNICKICNCKPHRLKANFLTNTVV